MINCPDNIDSSYFSARKNVIDKYDDAGFLLHNDPEKIIFGCNQAALDMFGFSRNELIGQSASILHTDQAASDGFHMRLHSSVEKREFFHLDLFADCRKNGLVFDSEHTVITITDSLLEFGGWLSIVEEHVPLISTENTTNKNENRKSERRDICYSVNYYL